MTTASSSASVTKPHNNTEMSRDIAAILRSSISNNSFLPADEVAASLRCFLGQIIALDGVPCAGKTHAGKMLRDYFLSHGIAAVFLEEKMNNVHLGAFYKEMARLEEMRKDEMKKPENERTPIPPNKHAFDLQLSAMHECISIYRDALWYAGRGVGGGKVHVVIIDRPVWGNRVFEQLHVSKGNISEEQHNIYDSYIIKHGPYLFDHLVYMHATPETAHHRIIVIRKHAEESAVPVEYLRELMHAYYVHLHRHIEMGDRALVVIANDDAYCSAEGILEALRRFRAPPRSARTIEQILSIPGEVSKVLGKLCEYYADEAAPAVPIINYSKVERM